MAVTNLKRNAAPPYPAPTRTKTAGAGQPVQVRSEHILLPTFLPAAPDRHPMFLEKRVYQGSSGKVYPLPFTDRIAETAVDHQWKAVWIENEFLRVMVLPEIGGRIHAILDKTNGYDLIYHQPVIKPALVGLAGPWISGGIEFNWPQHHRPATFLPVDFQVEEHPDGSKTVWCSDHDPMARMKGMHGVCLHPGRAIVELKVRAYNRTPFTQTFLWWANVATRVHEGCQSFFPPDVYYVADHARRAMSEYPLAKGFYYGINYGERSRKGIPAGELPGQFVPPHCRNSKPETQDAKLPDYAPNDLSFYANIPTPCSYMCMGSREDFFGGYDHFAQAGIVHVANHHISPGKKQWTWGNHEFGYAWDRHLTVKDARGEYGPYIEIMAGVYTDNQPDFSFLHPGETKSWSQYWYPIQKIGPAQQANLAAAVSLHVDSAKIRIGVSVTARFPRAIIRLERSSGATREWKVDLAPGRPFVIERDQSGNKWLPTETTLRVLTREGRQLIAYTPRPRARGKVPPPATEPAAPGDIHSADELHLAGLHLEQYRHATRCPTQYWREALRRDPLDARCNNALGLWHLRRGEFAEAEVHFRRAIERLTRRNANPYDGEPFYNLGLCLRYQLDSHPKPETQNSKFADAYAAFYKATWNNAWQAAAFHALAELDCRRGEWLTALEHLDRSLRFNTDNTRARNLKVIALRKLAELQKPPFDPEMFLRETLALDPLDWWARHLAGRPLTCDLQTALDLAHDFARAGFYAEAIDLLESRASRSRRRGPLPDQNPGAEPLLHYTIGRFHECAGNANAAAAACRRAAAASPDYCFPSRLEEIGVLEAAMRTGPKDARAPYYLGNLLYDRRRHREAIELWERSAKLDPRFSIVWRNLGIGYFNIARRPTRARAAYEKAFRADPSGRVLFERDQLWKRLGESPRRRLRELEKYPALVRERDDLTVELCALHNQTGRHPAALQLLRNRRFQPWEGGEGQALGQHVRAHLSLGREALNRGDAARAREWFDAALNSPGNLGEARHLLANQSDVRYWLGCALEALGEKDSARKQWLAAATFKGDFQEMSVRVFSEMTLYSALSWQRLGRNGKAKALLRRLLKHAKKLERTPAKIDYFATSLPAMLLFDDDLQLRQETTALFLQAQARFGLGANRAAKRLLRRVLKRDPNHAAASDFMKEITRDARLLAV